MVRLSIKQCEISELTIIVSIAVLFDICAIIAIILFFNHDVLAWVAADLVDIIIAVHFALVVAAYSAGSKENNGIDKEPA
ncbi:10171_t:CDS:2 [Cetraspora pellucida]|uniref:10171_t:CDS:1 n=1 Tax=Cetraspora pellucida TaxID=1433469 RepID=A0A9N9DRF9_9GLOM|nr:10171_t:CDS:2 [Cetraspora pellucida]